MLRTIAIGLLLTTMIPACFINGNGQAQGDAKDNGSGNANGNGTGNGSGNGSGNGVTPPAPPVVISDNVGPEDGTWDITMAGDGSIAPSEMTVVGGHATGRIVRRAEGNPDTLRWGCTRTVARTEIDLDIEADQVVGAFTLVEEWSGSGCPSANRRLMAVHGTRLAPGRNDVDGEWKVLIDEDGETTATLRLSASKGLMSATSDRSELVFAARKR